MRKICIVDLESKSVEYQEYDVNVQKYSGRSLAIHLVKKYTREDTSRYSKDNVIVFAVGLLTGTVAPSSGRVVIATKKDVGKGFQISNVTGDFPQKLASIGLEALIVKGESKDRNTVLYLAKDKVEIKGVEELEKAYVSTIIEYARGAWGDHCAVLGTAIGAEYMMGLSTTFSTYPLGKPEYYCPRNGFGDLWGSKGLKAVVVDSRKYFNNECFDKDRFVSTSKQISKLIMEDPICGTALPGHGSITLIKLLKEKNMVRANALETKMMREVSTVPSAIKLNKTCTPLCVIGCLNRHCSSEEDMFSAPAESEVHAALIHCYDIDDSLFAKKINTKAFELGIDSTEFVFTTHLYFAANGKIPNKEQIFALLTDIEKNTLIGRVIGSKTQGVYELYKDKKNLQALVTKPVITEEEKFKVEVDKFFSEFQELSSLELMYNQIFVLENMGFCIFTSFALINNKRALELIADLYYYKTGVKVTPQDLITFAGQCIEEELMYEKGSAQNTIKKNIPEFTKVLYRYFSN